MDSFGWVGRGWKFCETVLARSMVNDKHKKLTPVFGSVLDLKWIKENPEDSCDLLGDLSACWLGTFIVDTTPFDTWRFMKFCWEAEKDYWEPSISIKEGHTSID